MVARILRTPVLAKRQDGAVVPLGRSTAEDGQASPGEYRPELSPEHERLLAIALRDFQQRWEAREKEHALALEAAAASGAQHRDQEVADATYRLIAIATELQSQRDEILRGAEEAVVRLSLAIARRIVGEAVKLNDHLALETVRRALKHVADAQSIVIHVHPDDAHLVEQHAAEWSDAARRSRSLRVEADPRMRRGGCILEADTGQVAATIENQLETLETALTERLR